CIDSNGNYVQSGGTVIAKISTTDTSGNMSALDVDGSVKVTGGTLIAIGGYVNTPSTSLGVARFGSTSGGSMWGRSYSLSGSSNGSISLTSGTYTLKDSSGNVICTFKLSSSYSSMLIVSEKLTSGTSYTISGGSVSKTWTQN
ncbi:MAG: hypothetical protein K6B75_05860, partial [Lachnospiraceae bacterium]|nr:hypothetical protein [Lachnospiraceae bacterium]